MARGGYNDPTSSGNNVYTRRVKNAQPSLVLSPGDVRGEKILFVKFKNIWISSQGNKHVLLALGCFYLVEQLLENNDT